MNAPVTRYEAAQGGETPSLVSHYRIGPKEATTPLRGGREGELGGVARLVRPPAHGFVGAEVGVGVVVGGVTLVADGIVHEHESRGLRKLHGVDGNLAEQARTDDLAGIGGEANLPRDGVLLNAPAQAAHRRVHHPRANRKLSGVHSDFSLSSRAAHSLTMTL